MKQFFDRDFWGIGYVMMNFTVWWVRGQFVISRTLFAYKQTDIVQKKIYQIYLYFCRKPLVKCIKR